MSNIQTAMESIQKRINEGPYFDTSWDNFEQYQIPKWYKDKKLGIFIHWGVYTVPAYGDEWYPRRMYRKGCSENKGAYEHHLKTYGPQDQFGYKDFIPMFKAERFDPDEWARVFKESGAEFVMPVAEHHDGFAMYDTEYNRWNAAKMGPCRDVIKELSVSVREQGMRFAVSSHREEHYWFFDVAFDIPSDVFNEECKDLYDLAVRKDEMLDEECLNDWLVRTCELVDKFQPEVVFFDWWIEEACYAKHLLKFAAYYYNRCKDWGIEGAINYKNEAMPHYAGVFDVERGQLSGIRPLFWQTDTSVAYNSWSYVDDIQYRTPAALIHDFIDIISKNGGLLINVAPKSDGAIPEEQQMLLRELGEWLKVNGESVYYTRPWKIFGEGPTQVDEGMFGEKNRQDFGVGDIRFTTRDGNVYIHFMGWPESDVLTVRNFYKDRRFCPLKIERVEMLGLEGSLDFTRDQDGMHITLPKGERPCRHAWVLKLIPA